MTAGDCGLLALPNLTVRELLDRLGHQLQVTVLAGREGFDREITHPRIQKSGLSMVGHLRGVDRGRVQVLGETELSYAERLSPAEQRQAAEYVFSMDLACVLVTRGVRPPAPFCDAARATHTPLLLCQERSSAAITELHTLLDERLAPRTRTHGVLVDIFEVGVLLLGDSGIGKSETALELVKRGHRLVADDVVEFDYRPPGMVFGEAAALLRHHIEVRGLGILNIKDLYGVTAIRERKRVDLVVQLELWDEDAAYERVGADDRFHRILDVDIRLVTLPVRPGRNISSIIEIAARNELLRQAGHNPAQDFVNHIESELTPSDGSLQRAEPGVRKLGSGRIAPCPESASPPPVGFGRKL